MGAFFELMEITLNLSKFFGLTPFEMFRENSDEVILLINHYITKAENQVPTEKKAVNKSSKEERIRVNDKTATGGWF